MTPQKALVNTAPNSRVDELERGGGMGENNGNKEASPIIMTTTVNNIKRKIPSVIESQAGIVVYPIPFQS